MAGKQVKIELSFKAQHRQAAVADEVYTLRETEQPYGNHFDGEREGAKTK